MGKQIYPAAAVCCAMLAWAGLMLLNSDCMSVIYGGFDDVLIIAVFCSGVSGSIVLLPELIQESLQEEENSVY